jgi:hypothetical protein
MNKKINKNLKRLWQFYLFIKKIGKNKNEFYISYYYIFK